MLLYESEFESFINLDYTKLRISAQINDIDSRRSAEIEEDINKYIVSRIPDGLNAEVTGTALLALRTNNYLANNLLASFFIFYILNDKLFFQKTYSISDCYDCCCFRFFFFI